MHKFTQALVVAALLSPAAAFAQDGDTAPITVSGSAAVVSDYRFRGCRRPIAKWLCRLALPGLATKAASMSAPGAPTAGWGTFGGPNLELDLIAGYKATFNGGPRWMSA